MSVNYNSSNSRHSVLLFHPQHVLQTRKIALVRIRPIFFSLFIITIHVHVFDKRSTDYGGVINLRYSFTQ